jgi:hypothetical protein
MPIVEGVVEETEDAAVRGRAEVEVEIGSLLSGSLYQSIWEASSSLPLESRAQFDMVWRSVKNVSATGINTGDFTHHNRGSRE